MISDHGYNFFWLWSKSFCIFLIQFTTACDRFYDQFTTAVTQFCDESPFTTGSHTILRPQWPNTTWVTQKLRPPSQEICRIFCVQPQTYWKVLAWRILSCPINTCRDRHQSNVNRLLWTPTVRSGWIFFLVERGVVGFANRRARVFWVMEFVSPGAYGAGLWNLWTKEYPQCWVVGFVNRRATGC